ncbi:hypothetical protein [Acidiferrobacter sp.]|nr:hypothetical protein [Acidiferrobacter sp.]
MCAPRKPGYWRAMAEPALKTTRWRLLKRARNLAVHQSGNMRYPSPA